MLDVPQQFSLLFNSESPKVLHTFGHIDCPACESTQARMSITAEQLGRMSFEAAAPLWLEQKKRYLRPRTHELYGQHIKHAGVFLGKIQLKEIHIGAIRGFQEARLAGYFQQRHSDGSLQTIRWKKRAGPSLINHEVVAIAAVLKEAGEWDKIKPLYDALPLPAWRPQKVMNEQEEIMVMTVLRQLAERKCKWTPAGRIAYLTASLTCNTGACGTELRQLRLADINLHLRGFVCWDDTTKNRGRSIQLNATAESHMRECLDIAREHGSYLPEHYLFPFRVHRSKYDPTRPATESWLRKGYEELRAKTGFKWLTPHCMRHQFITSLIDAGVSLEQTQQLAGHKGSRMTRHYYHQRDDAQKRAVDLIDPLRRFGPKKEFEGLHVVHGRKVG